MSEELKPCPFCGKTESVRVYIEINGYTVRCCAGGISPENSGCGADCGFELTEEDAIKKWNARYKPQEVSNFDFDKYYPDEVKND